MEPPALRQSCAHRAAGCRQPLPASASAHASPAAARRSERRRRDTAPASRPAAGLQLHNQLPATAAAAAAAAAGVTETAPLWYLPAAAREEAIKRVSQQPVGSFVIRNSRSYAGGYGLAVKVAEPPKAAQQQQQQQQQTEDRGSELVRHFLIERTGKGVRLKGCPNEPTRASEEEMVQGAFLFVASVDLESLTGPGGVSRAADLALALQQQRRLRTSECQLRADCEGITVTDLCRKLFFRKHFPAASISHCGIDPFGRLLESEATAKVTRPRIFGFVARKSSGSFDNTGVILCELHEQHPAESIVQFVSQHLVRSHFTS